MDTILNDAATASVAGFIENKTTDELASLWLQVKSSERAIQAERLQIENLIIQRLGAKDEGAQTHTLDGGIKVTITGKLNYKADIPQLLALVDQLPEHLRPIKTVTTLDDVGAKYLRANEPELWRRIASAIEVKPAKTAVSIKSSSSSEA